MSTERRYVGMDWDRRGGHFRKRYVYFARVGQYVKVGFSVDPQRRIRAIRNGRLGMPGDVDMHAPVELLKVVPGGPEVEDAAHWALVEFHEYGEWFRAEPEVLAAIASFTGWPFPTVTKTPTAGENPRSPAVA